MKCQPAVDSVVEAGIAGSASAAVLDLSSLQSVNALVEQLSVDHPEIHSVFANAGATPQYPLTQEDLEDGFGGMHLAHMALLLGLLPSLKQAAVVAKEPSRVVMVSSEMAITAALGVFGPEPIFRKWMEEDDESEFGNNSSTRMVSSLDLQDVHGEVTRGDGTLGNSLPAYGRAKLCNVLFALELNRRMAAQNLPPPLAIAHAVHTGAVVTDSSRRNIQKVFSNFPGLATLVGRVYFPLLWRNVQGGARVLLCAALSDADYIVQGGQYLDALCHPVLPSTPNDKLQRQ